MQFTRLFKELGMNDVAIVGGKNASLGEMYSQLSASDVRVPNGFATTSEAWWYFIDHNNLRQPITDILAALDREDIKGLADTGRQIRDWIMHAEMPDDLAADIKKAYTWLGEEYSPNPDVAVRSSATAEDLPTASFAGQQETWLNIRGADNLIASCKRTYSSLFTDRAIAYRIDQGFEHMDVALSIGVQKMVRSDIGASGVLFTLDTESGFRDVVTITSAWGLGENVVQGTVNPDEFSVYKPGLAKGNRAILKRRLGDKALKMVYSQDNAAGLSTRNVPVHVNDRFRFSINDEEVLELARQAMAIEEHYGKPMDVEWARDGNDGLLYILQARPETVHTAASGNELIEFELEQRGDVIVEGRSIGRKIASGKARIILEAKDMHSLEAGEVLVTDITDPDWEPVMKRAAAIVTNRGGRTCHAAIVARELGIPAVVGTAKATRKIMDDEEVTISCAEGDTGFIYRGLLPFKTERIKLDDISKPKTKIMLNLANPDQAYGFAALPCDGVGLARLEFIINNSIGIHPRAILEPAEIDAATQKQINKRAAGYMSPRDFYITRLAEGVGTIAATFYPRPVIVRLGDFKSNEYAALIGGKFFEPEEENPMIGLRGASRYYNDEFTDSFALECEALLRVRRDMGLDNVSIMIPFVRSVDEARHVLELMARNGLQRGHDGLKVYLMCEVPANALLAEEFLELFDGFSIGSNDLTQLTLGVDRDSGLLSGFDERNPAVLALMEHAINACNTADKYVGICGQAPSDFPEITRWLVEHKIHSISLNPDSVLPMLQVVLEAEKKL
ncbi:MAG: phosphoenolpyruvate synthase [Gammaproteobacteria bacterium]|nr:phosphoenolpyruvate synthase [Gammaproteobacteria bacterium]